MTRIWVVAGLSFAIIAAAILWRVAVSSSVPSAKALYVSGELSKALELTSSEEVPASAEIFVVRAGCLRQFGRNEEFRRLLGVATERSLFSEEVQLLQALFNIQHASSGSLARGEPQQLIATLTSAGSATADAYSVVIQGLLSQNKLEDARRVLEAWQPDRASIAQRDYVRAVYENVRGELELAESLLLKCTEDHPQHELSWLALAELYARPPNVRFAHSQRVWQHIKNNFPANTEASFKLASVERRLGQPIAPSTELPAETRNELLEQAAQQFDRGEYSHAALTWQQLGMHDPSEIGVLIDRAFDLTVRGQAESANQLNERISQTLTTQALGGASLNAQTMFQRAANRTARLRRLQDLASEQSPINRSEQARETAEVSDLSTSALDLNESLSAEMRGLAGLVLYQKHCQNCHGQSGDGHGHASANLSPAARNFRREPMRLVSAINRLATDDDLMRTIRHGEPGTAMPAFKELSDADVVQLVAVLRRFMREGVAEQYDMLSSLGTQLGPRDLWIQQRIVPDEVIDVPTINPEKISTDEVAIIMTKSGCASCHRSQDQAAADATQLFDSLGRPMRAPDLERDAFHGGREASAIYKRLKLGIPGTPHPAHAALTEAELKTLAVFLTQGGVGSNRY